jgi:cytochrome P450
MTPAVAGLEAEFTALASEVIADPRPIYARLRDAAPAFKTPMGFWYVTSYELANAISTADGDWTVAASASHSPTHVDSFAFAVMARMMLTIDGPDHARLRRLVGGVFNPRGAEVLTEKVRKSIGRQLDELPTQGEIDLVADFAILLPTKVVLDVLGIPHDYLEQFIGVAESLIAMHEPTATEATVAHADTVFREAGEIVLELAAQRREQPADDVLTALVLAEDEGKSLSADELVAMILLLVVAGHETTANTFATGVYHLLECPSALAELRDDRAIMTSAVEELLRYDAATRNTVARYATRDLWLGDMPVRRGDKLFVGLHAANHDPLQFADPLRLNLRRKPNRHIAFNVGPHYCLGAALARLELRLAFDAFLSRYGSIEVAAGEPRWKRSFIIRGLESLPLRVSSNAI